MRMAAVPQTAVGERPISYGIVEGRAVFVDEQDDSYFMLEPQDETQVLEATDEYAEHSLASQAPQLLTGPRPATILEAFTRPPQRELSDQTRNHRAHLSDALRVAWVVLSARRDIARRPIAALLDELRNGAGSVGEDDIGSSAAALVARFLAARRFVPVASNCLLDSVALARWLSALAPLNMSLVFGAKLNPFAAHCWLQSGNLLVNDRLEYVARFTPVRVVPCSRATP